VSFKILSLFFCLPRFCPLEVSNRGILFLRSILSITKCILVAEGAISLAGAPATVTDPLDARNMGWLRSVGSIKL